MILGAVHRSPGICLTAEEREESTIFTISRNARCQQEELISNNSDYQGKRFRGDTLKKRQYSCSGR
jgi:hypothetical protein